mmetsp:Transcript_54898/g.80529  ORF Transcript_54898/g.80529 Transcript_54898/m.80529 type:complete len:202 (+) Transcript_54898:1581-2186(+)
MHSTWFCMGAIWRGILGWRRAFWGGCCRTQECYLAGGWALVEFQTRLFNRVLGGYQRRQLPAVAALGHVCQRANRHLALMGCSLTRLLHALAGTGIYGGRDVQRSPLRDWWGTLGMHHELCWKGVVRPLAYAGRRVAICRCCECQARRLEYERTHCVDASHQQRCVEHTRTRRACSLRRLDLDDWRSIHKWSSQCSRDQGV